MAVIDVSLERVTANDESATIVTIYAASGEAVEKDALIFDFENSKTTQELRAPACGVLVHELKTGQEVLFGVTIARIMTAAETPELANVLPFARGAEVLPPPTPPMPEMDPKPVVEPRFSAAARALIEELGLDRKTFSKSFITAADVRAQAAPAPAPAPAPVKDTRQAAPKLAPPKGNAVDFRKRAEIEVLSQGAGSTMLSVLGVRLGHIAITRAEDDFLAGRITDLVIFEAARLMKKFPKLNAAYQDGAVSLHEAVHAGLAIDEGNRLVVYGIENADQLSLSALGAAIADGAIRYLGDQLTAAELTRATFTVTDLSADGLDFIFPLLPRRQSLILAISHDEASGFRIFAGFDHRVTAGREIGRFLGELRTRVLTYAAHPAVPVSQPHCRYCAMTAQTAIGKHHDRGLLMVTDAAGQQVYCCASCWNGY
jgi:pyruvate/2-oxoglutarate dehydrogenase complex dihydrolipoamide acyltransferase (E2) component